MIRSSYRAALGRGLDDCVLLADRFADTWDEQYAEAWIVRRTAGAAHVLRVVRGWVRNIWRSPAGRLWAAQADVYANGVHVSAHAAPDAPFAFHALPGSLGGVWGLDDGEVFAWGRDAGRSVVLHWDGARWTEIGAPGDVVAMDGCAPDLVYAACRGGVLGRWDGGRWSCTALPFTLSSLRVLSEDEMYACAAPEVLVGSTRGWSTLATSTLGPNLITKLGAMVVTTLTPAGLARVDGSTLAPVAFEGAALSIDASDRLLVARADAIVEWAHGATTATLPLDELRALTKGVPPSW